MRYERTSQFSDRSLLQREFRTVNLVRARFLDIVSSSSRAYSLLNRALDDNSSLRYLSCTKRSDSRRKFRRRGCNRRVVPLLEMFGPSMTHFPFQDHPYPLVPRSFPIHCRENPILNERENVRSDPIQTNGLPFLPSQ